MNDYVRLVTSAGWNDVLDPLMVQPPDCDPDYKEQPNGNCGFPLVSIIYFVSFIIINFMIVINMYIAIILENFNQAHQEEEIGNWRFTNIFFQFFKSDVFHVKKQNIFKKLESESKIKPWFWLMYNIYKCLFVLSPNLKE